MSIKRDAEQAAETVSGDLREQRKALTTAFSNLAATRAKAEALAADMDALHCEMQVEHNETHLFLNDLKSRFSIK